MDELNGLIKIRKKGDPDRKWLSVAESQLMTHCTTCPCCNSEGERMTSGIDVYFRCPDCFCTWEVDREKVRAKAQELVERMKAEGAL